MKTDTSPEKINDFLNRGVTEVIVREHIEKKLSSGKSLRVKHGIDPTTADLHLGYGVVYLKLRLLQEMGHTIVFLIGDFTGRFGDPILEEARSLRPKKEVAETAKRYLEQVGMLLDRDSLEVRYNSEWYDKMNAEELLRIVSRFTVNQLLERDLFQARQKGGKPLYLHEPIYPVLQGYDSVMLESDLTVVGTDQIFNESRGRDLQRYFDQEPQDIVATEMLIGTDGKRKMSQSFGNYIAFLDPPREKFGKIMSLPDELIVPYFTLATRVPLKRIAEIEQGLSEGSLNPRNVKFDLAEEIVSLYHSRQEARKEREEFIRVFSKKEAPRELPTISVKKDSLELLSLIASSKLVSSKSEARRLIDEGAIEVEGKVKRDPHEIISIGDGLTVRVGKNRFFRVVPQ